MFNEKKLSNSEFNFDDQKKEFLEMDCWSLILAEIKRILEIEFADL